MGIVAGRYQLGDYVYDSDRGLLTHGSAEKRLEPQVNGLLKLLLQCPGEVVSRERIIGHIWPDRVVSDDALRAMIRKLRDAFSDDARNPSYIRTEPLKGYVLIAPTSQYFSTKAECDTRITRRRKTLFPAIGVLGVCAISATALWMSSDPAQSRNEIQLLTRMTGSEVSPDYSPAMNRLVFSHRANKDDFLQLYAKDLGTQQVQRLTWDSADYANAHWSPDGQEIVYSRSVDGNLEHYLAKFDQDLGIVGEQPLVLDQSSRRYLLSWSLSERAVYLKDGPRAGVPAGIGKLNLDTGEFSSVTAPNVQGAGDVFARESPDGKMLAVLREVEPGKEELLVLDKSTESLLHTRILISPADRLVWTEASDGITMSNFAGALQVFDLASNTLSLHTPVADGINDVFHQCGHQCVYMRQHNGNFLDVQEQPNPFLDRPLMASHNLDLPGAEDFPLFSADQRGVYFLEKTASELALKYRGQHGNPVAVYSFAADARVTALTLNGAGTHIAGILDDRVFVMRLREPSMEFISGGADLIGSPFWAADSSSLQFSRKEKGEVNLYRYELTTGRSSSIGQGLLADITLRSGVTLRIDADQKVWRHEENQPPIALTELPSAAPNRWQIRGDWLYFTNHEGNMAVMHRVNLHNGNSERVSLAKNRFRLNFDLSADSERVLFVKSLLAESNLVKVSLQ